MAPTASILLHHFLNTPPAKAIFKRQHVVTGDWRQVADQHPEDLVLESWSEGFMVGALIIMSAITIANMRRHVLLHKLVLTELLLAMTHGTFCFMTFDGYGWYLSSTAMLLYCSWVIHNCVAWMKVRPFFIQPGGFFNARVGKWTQRIYLSTLALTIPVIIFEISNNFRYFNNRGGYYVDVRPYEPLFRDPWWIFTCLSLFHVVRGVYGAGVFALLEHSPRFAILLVAITLAIIFTILDIVVSIHHFVGKTDGINPFWKLSLVFKCLTDTIMLDDFKTELKRLNVKRIKVDEKHRNSIALTPDFDDYQESVFTHPRRHAQLRLPSTISPLQSRSKLSAGDSDSTVFSKDLRDTKNEDPLSEYTVQRDKNRVHPHQSPPVSPQDRRRRDTMYTNPEAEEVEFADILDLDPRQVSGMDNVGAGRQANGRIHEHHLIGSTTKKLARLPGLNHLKFEAIKPGKRRKHSGQDLESGSSSDVDSHRERGNSDSSKESDLVDETIVDKDGNTRLRNVHEEIMRNTILDLEAQQSASKARKRSLNHTSASEAQPKSDPRPISRPSLSVDTRPCNSETRADSDHDIEMSTTNNKIKKSRKRPNLHNRATSRLEASLEDSSDEDEVDEDQRTRWFKGSSGLTEIECTGLGIGAEEKEKREIREEIRHQLGDEAWDEPNEDVDAEKNEKITDRKGSGSGSSGDLLMMESIEEGVEEKDVEDDIHPFPDLAATDLDEHEHEHEHEDDDTAADDTKQIHPGRLKSGTE